MPASGVLTIELPPPPPSRRALWVAVTITAVGVAMLLALARALMRGGPRRAPAATRVPSDRLRRQLDALDAAFARHPDPTDEARDAYQAHRRAIESQLAAALAREKRRV